MLNTGKTSNINYTKDLTNIEIQSDKIQKSVLEGKFNFDDFVKLSNKISSLFEQVTLLEKAFTNVNAGDISALSKESLSQIKSEAKELSDEYHKTVDDSGKHVTQKIKNEIERKIKEGTKEFTGTLGSIVNAYKDNDDYKKAMNVDNKKWREDRGIQNAKVGTNYQKALALYSALQKDIPTDENGRLNFGNIAPSLSFNKANDKDEDYKILLSTFSETGKRVQRLLFLEQLINQLESELNLSDNQKFKGFIDFGNSYKNPTSIGNQLRNKLEERIVKIATDKYNADQEDIPANISKMVLSDLEKQKNDSRGRNIMLTLPEEEKNISKYLLSLDDVKTKIKDIQNEINKRGEGKDQSRLKEMLKYVIRYKDLISELGEEEKKAQDLSLFSQDNGFDGEKIKNIWKLLEDFNKNDMALGLPFRESVGFIHQYKNDTFNKEGTITSRFDGNQTWVQSDQTTGFGIAKLNKIKKYLVSIEEAESQIKKLQAEIDTILNSENGDYILANKKQEEQLKYYTRLIKLQKQLKISSDNIRDVLGKTSDEDDVFDSLSQTFTSVKNGEEGFSKGLLNTLNLITQQSQKTSESIKEDLTSVSETAEKTGEKVDVTYNEAGEKSSNKSTTDVASIDGEAKDFVNLAESVGKVKTAVEDKNRTIKDEVTLVNDGVKKEIEKFGELKTKLSEISNKENWEVPINVKPNVDPKEFVDEIQKNIDGASIHIGVDGNYSGENVISHGINKNNFFNVISK